MIYLIYERLYSSNWFVHCYCSNEQNAINYCKKHESEHFEYKYELVCQCKDEIDNAVIETTNN